MALSPDSTTNVILKNIKWDVFLQLRYLSASKGHNSTTREPTHRCMLSFRLSYHRRPRPCLTASLQSCYLSSLWLPIWKSWTCSNWIQPTQHPYTGFTISTMRQEALKMVLGQKQALHFIVPYDTASWEAQGCPCPPQYRCNLISLTSR